MEESVPPTPVLFIRLFGSLEVSGDPRPIIRFRTRRTASLFAYLVHHADRSHTREALAERFWPESDDARDSLNTALWWLRGALAGPTEEDGFFVADRSRVAIRRTRFTTDVTAFEIALARARATPQAGERLTHLRAAVDLYRGPFLADLDDEWILPEQIRLEALFAQALHDLCRLHESRGAVAEALHWALQGLRLHPYREDTAQDVMRFAQALGRPAAALAHFRSLATLLERDLAVRPGREIVALALAVQKEVQAARLSTESGRLPMVSAPLERTAGPLPLESSFYVERGADRELCASVRRGEGTILLTGPPGSGKSSLLGRGLALGREAGYRTVLTDLLAFPREEHGVPAQLLLWLAETLAEQLGAPVSPRENWTVEHGPSVNLDRYLRRHILPASPPHLVWALDEVDQLFDTPAGTEAFRLFRAWHNQRVLAPGGMLSRLTLLLAYSGDAHLFIRDPNQSPFNVGTRLRLEPFTTEQVGELNQRYGAPLRSAAEVEQLHQLTGGHPSLVRRSLEALVHDGYTLDRLAASAHEYPHLFGDHLSALRTHIAQDRELVDALSAALVHRRCSPEAFYRLASAGILDPASERKPRFTAEIYRTYFAARLA